ncbi:MAG: SRPBCC family protein [Pirellulales bacterium]
MDPIVIEPLAGRRGEYVLQATQWLPRGLDEVFAFFADAFQLEAITPPWLRFRVLTPQPIAMRAGTLIDYKLRLHGIPIRWRTEISDWSPPTRFIDRQLRGPYYLWHHEHTFQAQDGGTLIADRVEYRPRGGAWLHRKFIRPDLMRIFAYRRNSLQQLLGTPDKQNRR